MKLAEMRINGDITADQQHDAQKTIAIAGGIAIATGGTAAVIPEVAGGVAVAGEKETVKALAKEGIRTEAKNLTEKLAMEEAKTAETVSNGKVREIMQGKINDPARPSDIYKKMEYIKDAYNDAEKVVIHYWENIETGVRDTFKFK